MRRFRTSKLLSFVNTQFDGPVSMSSVRIDGDLILQDSIFKGNVLLTNAKIAGNLDMGSSEFQSAANMRLLSVGSNLIMDSTYKGFVRLPLAKIEGSLRLEGEFEGPLDMSSATIGGDLFMGDFGRFAMDVDMSWVKIGRDLDMSVSVPRNSSGQRLVGQLLMSGWKFSEELDISSTSIGRDLLVQNTQFKKSVNLGSLRVGSNLDARGATFELLDLNGAQIEGTLRLGPSLDKQMEWKGHAHSLDLRNASVGVLQDTTDAWPQHVELDGFTYRRYRVNKLGPNTGNGSEWFGVWPLHLELVGSSYQRSRKNEDDSIYGRGSDWFIERWLGKTRFFSPQPYRQLAGVLRFDGFDDIADEHSICGSGARKGISRDT